VDRTSHRIADLGRPRLAWPIRALNVALRPASHRLASLDATELLAAAQKREKLADFGDDSFREPLQVLLDALSNQAHLSPLGRLMARHLVLQLLCTRLRAEDLLRRHAEILDEEVRAPIFIVGLPRTGTTHLHNLISQDPSLRSLPYWECLEPIPPTRERLKPGEPDPRFRRCEQALRLQHYFMPLFPLMHEMTAESRHEEIQLLAISFSTMLFEPMYEIPRYRDWYRATDQTFAYAYLRRMLQILQWLRGPKRWVLKSPQHLEQLRPLLAVFPDATIIQTHRDPVRITASMCTMAAYSLRMQNESIDPHRVGRYWADRVEDLLRSAVEQRVLLPDAQVMDVRFDEFMADQRSAVERVLNKAGHPLTAQARAAMEQYLREHERGRLGSIEYRLDDFGLDEAERRQALKFYQDRFQVPDEPARRATMAQRLDGAVEQTYRQ